MDLDDDERETLPSLNVHATMGCVWQSNTLQSIKTTFDPSIRTTIDSMRKKIISQLSISLSRTLKQTHHHPSQRRYIKKLGKVVKVYFLQQHQLLHSQNKAHCSQNSHFQRGHILQLSIAKFTPTESRDILKPLFYTMSPDDRIFWFGGNKLYIYDKNLKMWCGVLCCVWMVDGGKV